MLARIQRSLAASLAITLLAACSAAAEDADAADDSNAAASATTAPCPSPFVGHDTPQTAFELGHMIDNVDKPLEAVGSLAVGQTAYFVFTTEDKTDLIDPSFTVMANSVHRTAAKDVLLRGDSSGLDVEVTYYCNAPGRVLCLTLSSETPANGNTCTARSEVTTMVPECTGLDESGKAVVRVHRKAAAKVDAAAGPSTVPSSCGLLRVRSQIYVNHG